MAKIFKVHFYAHNYEYNTRIVAEDEKSARIMAAHSHGISAKHVKIIECVDNDYHGEYFMDDNKNEVQYEKS